MTLRILYVSHSFPLPDRPLSNVGGMQRVAVDLHRALGTHPSVELSSLLLETSWRWTGARTLPFLLRSLWTIPRIVRNNEIDVVLFSSMVTASVSVFLRDAVHAAGAVTAAIPVGRDVTLPTRSYQRFVPRALKALDFVFPISRATAEACLERGAIPERVHIVPCGIALPPRADDAPREGRRRALLDLLRSRGHPLADDALLLLSVGRHQERKGFHWFVDEVMPRTSDNIVYLLAGEGPMTTRVTEAVRRNGLEGRVILLGQVDEFLLETLYSGADLFMMPNIPVRGDIEGFGVVMLEAGAAGLPVIAADLEGIRDVIAEGVNGHLVPTRDAASFLAVIGRYQDREALDRSADRAAEYVRERFGWEGIVERYLEILTPR